MKKITEVLILMQLLGLCLDAQSDDRLKWFDEARFGMFIHWGVYAVHGNRWQGKSYVDGGKNPSEWLMQRVPIPVTEYRQLAKQFTAANYDPSAWAGLAREAGMKYVVITSKHHDGFALYPTAFSDWNISITPAKNDLLAPLAEACRNEGLRFGLYYSQCQDWVNPGGAKRNPYHKSDGKRNMDEGDGWDDLQKGSYDAYLQNIALSQVHEILERYKPDIIWWDTPVHMTEKRARLFHDAVAAYPNIITNSRLGGPYKGDTRNPEQWVPPEGYPGERFEVCMTINDTWGYAIDDNNWKSTTLLLQTLSDTVSKGGNLLLNVGPTADGIIPEPSVKRLREIGVWMQTYGHAIHGSRPSPYPRQLPWGRMTRKAGQNGGEILYLHIWEWPESGTLTLPTISQTPLSAVLLPERKSVKTEVKAGDLIITLPDGGPPNEYISMVEVTFDQPVVVSQEAYLSPGPDGIFHLHPRDADRYGDTAGVMDLLGQGSASKLANWINPKWHIKYRIRTGAAKRYRISAEIASTKDSEIRVGVGTQSSAIKIPETGANWTNVELGELLFSDDESTITIRAGNNWNPIEIRTVTLLPVGN